MELIHVGFGNMVNADKIIAVVSPDGAPIKRLVSKAKDENRTIDASAGRKTKAVIIMEDGSVVLSALLPGTIKARTGQEVPSGEEKAEEEKE